MLISGRLTWTDLFHSCHSSFRQQLVAPSTSSSRLLRLVSSTDAQPSTLKMIPWSPESDSCPVDDALVLGNLPNWVRSSLLLPHLSSSELSAQSLVAEHVCICSWRLLMDIPTRQGLVNLKLTDPILVCAKKIVRWNWTHPKPSIFSWFDSLDEVFANN